MKLGMCMASLLDRDWEAALDATAELGILAVEPMGGGHVPKRHVDPVALAGSQAARDALLRPVAERGMEIAALGCYGNFLDPDPGERARQQADLRAAIRAAAELGLRTVTSNAGCPPGAPGDASPNWIVNSLFPAAGTRPTAGSGRPASCRSGRRWAGSPRSTTSASGARADGRRRGLQPRHLQAAARGRRRADPVPRRPVPPVVAGDRHRRVRRRRRRRGRFAHAKDVDFQAACCAPRAGCRAAATTTGTPLVVDAGDRPRPRRDVLALVPRRPAPGRLRRHGGDRVPGALPLGRGRPAHVGRAR